MPLFGGLRWRRKDIVIMEENYNNADEEKNIFYEYFELKSKAKITTDTEIEQCKEMFCQHFQDFVQDFDTKLEKIWNNNKSTTAKILSTIKLYKNDTSAQCVDNFKEFACLFIKFLEGNSLYTEEIQNLLSSYRKCVAYCDNIKENKKGNIGLICEMSNVVEFSYIMYKCIVTNDIYTQSFNEGLRILKLDATFHIMAVIKTIIAIDIIVDEIKTPVCSIICEILRKIFYYKYKIKHKYLTDKEEFPINYLLIAEKAYSKQISNNLFLKEDKQYKTPINTVPLSNAENLGLRKDAYFSFYGFVSGYVFNHKNSEIVIGFSGTKTFKNDKSGCIHNWIVNFSQITEISCSYIFAVGFVNLIKNIIPNKNLVVCGHSLGGGLSQFAAAPHKGRIKAYCFNSAGLVGAYKHIKKFKPFQNIYHYRLKNDKVSRIGNLIGEVYTIKYPKPCNESHGVNSIKDAIKNL